MKSTISIALLLTCAFPMDAQVTATFDRHPARSPEIALRNDSAVSMAAFVVSVKASSADTANNAPFTLYVDPAVDERAAPLPPHQEYRVAVPSQLRTGQPVALYEPPIVSAGIFADGTTAGDPALLDRLLLRRRCMLQSVELAWEILSKAGRRNMARGDLVDQFHMMADSMSRWYLPAEQQVGRALYQSIAQRLMNLSPLPLGAPFPPTAFVEQETALLNRRRTMLLESRMNLMDGGAGPR